MYIYIMCKHIYIYTDAYTQACIRVHVSNIICTHPYTHIYFFSSMFCMNEVFWGVR